MPERILVFGNGWLGNKLADALGGAIIKVDIANRESVMKVLDGYHPDVVINAAGKTGRPNVDGCESDPAGTLLSNVAGPIILAEECMSRGIFMAHLGSGCVYNDSESGYTEESPPNFFGSIYSRSKALSEKALSELPILQVRLRMPFDGEPGPRNLITKIAGYKKVISVPNSLTYVPDFVRAVRELLEKKKTGIWNVVNPGQITHAQILELYREIVDPSHTFEQFSVEELAKITKAGRSNCVLSNAKLEAEGIKMTEIGAAIIEALSRYKENLRCTA